MARPLIVSLLVLASTAPAWAAEDGLDLPELPQRGKLERRQTRRGRAERLGVLRLSDGTEVGGKVHLTPGKTLRLYDAERGRWVDVDLRQVSTLRLRVEWEKKVPVWRWKESGKDEKVLTGEHYIDRRYLATLKLTRGNKEHTGHLLGTVVYVVDAEDERHKFFLKKDDRGAIGRPPEALVYVQEIDLRRGALETWQKEQERKAKEEAERKAKEEEAAGQETEERPEEKQAEGEAPPEAAP